MTQRKQVREDLLREGDALWSRMNALVHYLNQNWQSGSPSWVISADSPEYVSEYLALLERHCDSLEYALDLFFYSVDLDMSDDLLSTEMQLRYRETSAQTLKNSVRKFAESLKADYQTLSEKVKKVQ